MVKTTSIGKNGKEKEIFEMLSHRSAEAPRTNLGFLGKREPRKRAGYSKANRLTLRWYGGAS